VTAPAGPPQDRSALPYRACVGIMLLSPDRRIFIGDRRDTPGAWQMPQGGIDRGETAVEAGFRELEEETGTARAELLAEAPDWLFYDFPAELYGSRVGRRYRGQKQRWLAMRFLGEDDEIDPLNTRHPEFRQWRWATPDEVLARIVPFKRPVYEAVLDVFAPLLRPSEAA
jgi:putative (di)nucleoside polyphosphate hydrolase